VSVDITERSLEDQWFSSVAGSLIGAASADALGWITESVHDRDHLRKLYGIEYVTEHRSWQKTTDGRFNAYIDYISRGEYSDDTQVTLAVARSLRNDGSIDIQRFSKCELPLWLDYSQGAGATVTAGARALARRSTSWNNNFFSYQHDGKGRDYRSAGANGAAMRVGPIALANLHDPYRMLMGVWKTSICTHGHPRALLGALVYAETVRLCTLHGAAIRPSLLQKLAEFTVESEVPARDALRGWLARWDEDAEEPFTSVWSAVKTEVLQALELISRAHDDSHALRVMHELGCFDPARRGSGTATVLAGIALFLVAGDRFRDAVLLAVNALGSDTDTIAGFVGGMCGAAHGYEQVPHEWASEVQDYDYFIRVATEVTRIACRKGLGDAALKPKIEVMPRNELPDLVQKLRSHNISQGERVHHPVFGAGRVKSVEIQKLRRKDGATLVLAWVQFDMGQSCKFRHMKIPQETS
jgi:ADP-ribosylglycohydrolase